MLKTRLNGLIFQALDYQANEFDTSTFTFTFEDDLMQRIRWNNRINRYFHLSVTSTSRFSVSRTVLLTRVAHRATPRPGMFFILSARLTLTREAWCSRSTLLWVTFVFFSFEPRQRRQFEYVWGQTDLNKCRDRQIIASHTSPRD